MRFRKLRIAWSVFWGVACVLVVGVCIRSYGRPVDFEMLDFRCQSIRGLLMVCMVQIPQPTSTVYDGAMLIVIDKVEFIPRAGFLGFAASWTSSSFWSIQVPYWALITLCAVVAAIPWVGLAKRFSLRTLLIATTLVAVVLGLVVVTRSGQ
jgi:hypothetical protein